MNSNTRLPEKALKRLYIISINLIDFLEDSVCKKNSAADVALSKWIKERKELGARDRRFLYKISFAHFRWYGWCRNKLGLDIHNALLLTSLIENTGGLQWTKFLKNHRDNANALKSVANLNIEEKAKEVSLFYNNKVLADDLIPAKSKEYIPAEYLKSCIGPFQNRPPAWIRTRSQKENIINALVKFDIDFSKNESIQEAIAIKGGINLNHYLKKLSCQYVIQDISSQCVGLIADPKVNQIWWDCCAGSGGKALHLSDLMKQNGQVFATDKRPSIINKLKKRARSMGAKIIVPKVHDVIKDLPIKTKFDGIIVDAPCSGWGTWGRNPDARWRSPSLDILAQSKKQYEILRNASKFLKPGGTLIYSVCTITDMETKNVVNKFLSQSPDYSLDPFINPLANSDCNGCLQILPTNDYNGMFIAKLKRAA